MSTHPPDQESAPPLVTYLAGVDPDAVPLVIALDDAVRSAHPGFDVAIKYGLLMYALQRDWRTWVCAIGATKRGVSLRFLYGVLFDDPLGVLRAGSSVLSSWDFATGDAVDRSAVGTYVAEAVARYAFYKSNSAEIFGIGPGGGAGESTSGAGHLIGVGIARRGGSADPAGATRRSNRAGRHCAREAGFLKLDGAMDEREVMASVLELDAARAPVAGMRIPASHLDLAECPPIAALTTRMPDGYPQTSVVWCDFDGTCIRVNTMAGFQKERNMRRDPRVTLLCYDPRNSLRSLEVRGTVVEMTEAGAMAHLDAIASKYTGRRVRYFGDVVPLRFAETEIPVLCRILPTHVVTLDWPADGRGPA